MEKEQEAGMNAEYFETNTEDFEDEEPCEAFQAAVRQYAESAPEADPCGWYAEMASWLEMVKAQLRDRPDTVRGPLGDHPVYYNIDEMDEEYALVAFPLPDEVYAEIEDSTYGVMEGFRLYL